MKKRFPFWTLGLLGILIVILVPVLYFLSARREPVLETVVAPPDAAICRS